jgi:hypothetical protein
MSQPKTIKKISQSIDGQTNPASYRAIIAQVKDVLLAFNPSENGLDDYNGFSIAEDFYDCTMANVMLDGYTIDSAFEGGRLTATVRHGNNDGWIIDVNHMNPNGRKSAYHSIVSIHYWVSEDEVWLLAKTLNAAIDQGR